MPITVAILTVSDTAFAASSDPSADRSGPALRQLLTDFPDSPYKIVSSAIVPDDQTEIRKSCLAWCKEGVNLILTSGGTGFGVRDGTPEALSQLIDKEAPGLVHMMLSSSLNITPLAALARPVAGIHLRSHPSPESGHGTVLISLPGSPKGAKENLQAIMGVLPHAVELATGGSGRKVHEEMGAPARRGDAQVDERDAKRENETNVLPPPSGTESHTHHHGQSHSHSHAPGAGGHHHGHGGHHHHKHDHATHGHAVPTPRTVLSLDPSISAAQRQRISPYPLVPLRDAIKLIFDHTSTTAIVTLPFDHLQVGHVLAEDVFATKDVPEFPCTNVDGYALRSSDEAGVYNVLTSYPSTSLLPGTIYRINTGAPLPPGTDSVIMVEDTIVTSRFPDDLGGDEKEVQTLAKVDEGENVRRPGSDVKSGEKVLEKGDVILGVGGELGTLGFVGKKSAKVYRRPVVAVLSTGNELANVVDANPRQNPSSAFSAIPDSNRPSLLSILANLGFETIDLGIVEDSMAETTKVLKKGKEQADVVITTGGTSMGVGDLLKPCIERELGGTVHFGRVAMKPGKPTTFATIPPHPIDPNQTPKLIFALPGNPASALVTFFIFVLPALRKLEGRKQAEWELPRIPVEISTDISLDPRPEYHRVWLRPNGDYKTSGASLIASSTGGQRSSRTVSLAVTNGLLELPALIKGGEKTLKKGSVVSCVVVGELGA